MSAHPHVVSHRGLGFGHPENTVAAFSAVRAHGRVGVELDARITRDGVAVVCHDADARLPDGSRVVLANVEASALRGVVPTLRDALHVLGDLLVDLEIKPTEAPIDPILADIGSARVRISSFSTAVLEQAHAKAPAIERALLLDADTDLSRSTAEATLVGARAVHPHRSLLSPAHVSGWRAAGLSVRAYTLNAEDDWGYAADLAIDAIITDRPVELADYLSRSVARRPSR